MDATECSRGWRRRSTAAHSRERYARYRPGDTVLYEAVQRHGRTFFERLNEQAATLPAFVGKEIEQYLRCGAGLDWFPPQERLDLCSVLLMARLRILNVQNDIIIV